MNREEVKIINRGRGRVLFNGGHQYYSHVVYKNGTSNWRCKLFKAKKCAGSVTLSTDQKCILKYKPHCNECSPDTTQNIIEGIINDHCEEAVKGREPAPRIYKRALVKIADEGLDLAAIKPVPTFKEKKDSIYRRRNKNAGVTRCSRNTAFEVEVPNQFKDFVLADYKDDDEMNDDQSIQQFKHYFQSYWMKGEFSKIWCVFGERHRTNNAAEGWHHALNTNINKNEVQLLQILHILREESSLATLRINQYREFNKSSPPKRRKMYIATDTRIMNAQMQIINGNISIGHFLDKLR